MITECCVTVTLRLTFYSIRRIRALGVTVHPKKPFVTSYTYYIENNVKHNYIKTVIELYKYDNDLNNGSKTWKVTYVYIYFVQNSTCILHSMLNFRLSYKMFENILPIWRNNISKCKIKECKFNLPRTDMHKYRYYKLKQ